MTITHTKDFIDRFRQVLHKTYGYDLYMDLCVVPSILSAPVLSYMPLLNYTDRLHDDVDDLLELAKESDYLIRALNPDQKEFDADEPVAMRLEIDSSKPEDLMLLAKSRCRNKIRNSSKKFHYALKSGRACIDDFYEILSQTYHRHGTPILPKKLFYELQDEFEEKLIFFVSYDEQGHPAAAMSVFVDETLAWYAWGGVEETYSQKLAGYYIYFEVLKRVTHDFDIKVFDFGRSPFEGSTYRFKSQFGAKPVKIELIKPDNEDLYSKYAFAAKLWQKLPRSVVQKLGPRLTKYLADL